MVQSNIRNPKRIGRLDFTRDAPLRAPVLVWTLFSKRVRKSRWARSPGSLCPIQRPRESCSASHRLPGREHEVVVSKKLSLKHVGGRKVLTFTKLHPKMVRTHPEMINQGAPVKPRIKSWERRAISAEFAKTSAVVRRPAGDNELGAIRFQSVRFRTATAANWAHPARLLDSQIVHPALRPRHLMAMRDPPTSAREQSPNTPCVLSPDGCCESLRCVVARTTRVAHIQPLKCASCWRS
ncbi:hypothetical protein ACVWXO_006394 [Bradyrhizobium sp. LM2.7]